MKSMFLAQWDFETSDGKLFTECRIVLADNIAEAEGKAKEHFVEYKKRLVDASVVDTNVHPVIL